MSGTWVISARALRKDYGKEPGSRTRSRASAWMS